MVWGGASRRHNPPGIEYQRVIRRWWYRARDRDEYSHSARRYQRHDQQRFRTQVPLSRERVRRDGQGQVAPSPAAP